MLAIPEIGFNRSINVHNVDFDAMCDWVEANCLFSEDPITKSDIVDSLVDNEIYEEQDFANERLDSVWQVLRLRSERMGNPLQVTPNRITRTKRWDELPAYSFCMLLACISYLYPRWARGLDRAIGEQGSLFEKLAVQSVAKMLPDWEVRRIGWAADNPVKLKSCIHGIISDLNEVGGAEIDLHVDQSANELGLDLLAFYSFGDSHASFPIVMLQCASGKDWIKKRKTPDLSVWRKVINFNSSPVKGIIIPYSFADQKTFRREATTVEGIFLDRYRVLVPRAGITGNWVSEELNSELLNWVRPYVERLPMLEEIV